MSLQAHFAAKRPRYQLIAEELAERIESGAFAEGELMPSEAQLCENYGVSRHTVREAIRTLSSLGLVDARPGIGTRVIRARSGAYVQTLKEIGDLQDYAQQTSRKVIAQKTLHGGEAQFELPGNPGKAWRMVEAVRHVSGNETEVIAWTQIFVSPKYGASLDATGSNELVHRVIERDHGIRTGRLRQDVYAIGAPESAASWLGLTAGAPALAIRREYYDAEDKVFEVAIGIHPPERYRHSTQFRLVMTPGSGAPLS